VEYSQNLFGFFCRRFGLCRFFNGGFFLNNFFFNSFFGRRRRCHLATHKQQRTYE
jgi:hypothetical protein